MKNEKVILYGIMGALVGVAVTVVVISNVINSNQYGMMQMMGIRINNQNNRMMSNIDKHFIEEMIPHHEGAIDMAKLALNQASKPEIKTLANNIIKSQTKEIEQMRGWYKNWYGTDVPEETGRDIGMGRGMMHGGMMGEGTDTTILKESKNFDKTFIDEMIPHHQMAVMMSNMLLAATNRPEMRELGKNIISAQTKEIEQMRGWYEAWGY